MQPSVTQLSSRAFNLTIRNDAIDVFVQSKTSILLQQSMLGFSFSMWVRREVGHREVSVPAQIVSASEGIFSREGFETYAFNGTGYVMSACARKECAAVPYKEWKSHRLAQLKWRAPPGVGQGKTFVCLKDQCIMLRDGRQCWKKVVACTPL